MCSGGGGRTPDPPKERPPQVLRNPRLDLRAGLANRGIGALTIRPGDNLRFRKNGSVKPNERLNQLKPGSAQGTGKFTELTFGAADREKNIRRKERRRAQRLLSDMNKRRDDPHNDDRGR